MAEQQFRLSELGRFLREHPGVRFHVHVPGYSAELIVQDNLTQGEQEEFDHFYHIGPDATISVTG